MTVLFMFPEVFEPEGPLHPARLKVPGGSQASCPEQQSPGDAFVANARSEEDMEPLARVLKKYPDLRAALYKALDEEGAFTFFPAKSSK